MRFLLACLVVLFAACDLAPRQTTDPTREQWEAMAPQYKERVAGLKNRQTVVGGRVAALTVPPGVNDPGLAAQIADMQVKANELAAAISAFEQAVSQVNGEIEAAISRRDKIGARRLVDVAGQRLDQAYSAAVMPFDALEQRLPDAEAATSRHLATVAAEEQRLVRIASEGGAIDLNVKYQGTALDLADAGTKAAFDRLVKLASACDQLRLTVSAAAAAHAEDVKTKLVNAGVPADRVASGLDTTKQLTAAQLKVTVTTPCLPAVPAAAGAGAPPPPPAGAGTAPPPPPPTAVVERVRPTGAH